MQAILTFLLKRAEDVLVFLAAAMFFAFIVQIGTRYLLNDPAAWPHEVIVVTWLWLIFWGSAFFIKDKDHVKFDVFYTMGQAKTRRLFSLATSITLLVFLVISVPATWGFITFKGIRGTDHFNIPLSWVFSVYMVFLVGTIIHYAHRTYQLLKGEDMEKIEKGEVL